MIPSSILRLPHPIGVMNHVDSHSCQNDPSSMPPANASQAIAIPNREAPTRNVANEEPTFGVSPSSKRLLADGGKADKVEVKRKRCIDDEIAHITTRKRTIHEIDNDKKDYTSDDPSVESDDE